MPRLNTNDLIGFLAVARERSFTKAAASLGVSPSALSHSMRALEERLGLRLLARTTRSVTPTEAGERLLLRIGPRFDEIEAEVAALSELREKPAGNIRISADEVAVTTILWPALRAVLPSYPEIKVEISTDNGLVDIVAGRYDAGVRIGEIVAKDMIAVPIGPPMRMVAVAAPSYFATRPKPKTPNDLTAHTCISIRLPTHGGLYAWEFEKAGREFRVRVDGQLVFNSISQILQAALDGFGIAYVADALAQPHLESGRLVSVLSAWSPPFPGYHLYYPSRHQHTSAFAVLVAALRYRTPTAPSRDRV
jgi:DNA-binding transcriptional LysR family regulator